MNLINRGMSPERNGISGSASSRYCRVAMDPIEIANLTHQHGGYGPARVGRVKGFKMVSMTCWDISCKTEDFKQTENYPTTTGNPSNHDGQKKWCFTQKKLSPGRIHLGFNQGQWLQISSAILGICFQVQHGRMVKLDRKEEMSVKFHGSLGFAGPVKETAMILQVPTNLRHSNRDFSPQISHDIPNIPSGNLT